MATRRSKALQLFVYMSRTSARGTSAFLERKKKAVKNRKFIEVLGYTCCSSRRYISVFQLHPEQDEGIDYKVA